MDLSEQIEAAVSAALQNCRNQNGLSSPPKKRGQAGGNKGDSDIIARVLALLQPILTSVINAVVKTSHEAILQEIQELKQRTPTASQNRQQESDLLMRNKFEVDKLEQYSRRENLRIIGLPTTENENVEGKVLKLGQDLGVEIRKEDISTAHMVRSKGKRGDPILVRFVRREKKHEMMRMKKG